MLKKKKSQSIVRKQVVFEYEKAEQEEYEE